MTMEILWLGSDGSADSLLGNSDISNSILGIAETHESCGRMVPIRETLAIGTGSQTPALVRASRTAVQIGRDERAAAAIRNRRAGARRVEHSRQGAARARRC